MSFEIEQPARVAIVGPSGSGKEELCLVLANLLDPSRGRLLINDKPLNELADSLTGRRLAYVGNPSAILTGTIRHNLLYGLMHRPVRDEIVAAPTGPYEPDQLSETPEQRARRLKENALSGNSPYDCDVDWINYAEVGLGTEERPSGDKRSSTP
jgi:putative ABC transport system ATP-binding protein